MGKALDGTADLAISNGDYVPYSMNSEQELGYSSPVASEKETNHLPLLKQTPRNQPQPNATLGAK